MNKRWWHHAVVYQIYPKSFLDSNHDGIGDLKGITSKLNYLSDLGIDVIWISPFYQSPMADNGYDISDYKQIDPIFGTMEDFDELLNKANQLGIKIIIDLVVNHTSDEHPWFLESKKSKTNLKRDWYIWKDGKNLNNWRSCFGGSVWEYDEQTDASYFHFFHKKQPCLNWENKEVRNAIYEMIIWWLDKGISGFRVDAINIIKKANLDQNFDVDGEDGLASSEKGSVNVKGIEVFLNELATHTFNKYDIMTVAESDVPIEEQELWTGINGFFDMAFQLKSSMLDIENGIWYKRRQFDLVEWKNVIDLEQSSLNQNTWAAVWLENHDNPRSLDKYLGVHASLTSAKMLAALFFFQKGTIFMYQGQEIGMRNVAYKSIESYDDIASLDHYTRAINLGYSKEQALDFVYKRSRDNARYPMQWDRTPYYGFSNVKPWLDINTEFPEITVSNAIKDKNSLFYFYQEMIKLRKTEDFQEVFSYGSFKMLYKEDAEIFAYLRVYEQTQILVVGNFSSAEKAFKNEYEMKEVLLNNYQDLNKLEETYILKPFQTLVINLKTKDDQL